MYPTHFRLHERRRHPGLQHDRAGVGDHGAVVAHEPLFGDVELRTPLLAHYLQHLTEAEVGADAAPPGGSPSSRRGLTPTAISPSQTPRTSKGAAKVVLEDGGVRFLGLFAR